MGSRLDFFFFFVFLINVSRESTVSDKITKMRHLIYLSRISENSTGNVIRLIKELIYLRVETYQVGITRCDILTISFDIHITLKSTCEFCVQAFLIKQDNMLPFISREKLK